MRKSFTRRPTNRRDCPGRRRAPRPDARGSPRKKKGGQLGHLQVQHRALHHRRVQGSGDLVDVDPDTPELALHLDQRHGVTTAQLRPMMQPRPDQGDRPLGPRHARARRLRLQDSQVGGRQAKSELAAQPRRRCLHGLGQGRQRGLLHQTSQQPRPPAPRRRGGVEPADEMGRDAKGKAVHGVSVCQTLPAQSLSCPRPSPPSPRRPTGLPALPSAAGSGRSPAALRAPHPGRGSGILAQTSAEARHADDPPVWRVPAPPRAPDCR